MRISVLIFLVILSLCSTGVVAQRQQVTEYYRPPLDIPMTGEITYSYIVDKNGDNQKDGPLSIKASIDNFVTYVRFQKMTVNGNYNLTANYKSGNMNGILSLNSRTTHTYGAETQVESFTLNGNFKDGIPNGNFVANYVTTVEAKMNVNYKNGKLVGPYMVDYSTALVDREAIKGTLTSNGELTGRWDFNYIDSRCTYTFLKGVRISMSSKDSSTPPFLVEKSRQFANGGITEDKLYEQGIMVVEDSIDLGIHANRIILRDDVINFRDLRGCDFSTSNVKKFRYLKEMVYLTDEGFNVLLNSVRKSIVENEYDIDKFSQLTSSADQFERVIATDEKGMKYVNMGMYNYHLTSAKKFKGILHDRIYLTKEQIAALPGKIDRIRKETAVGLLDFLKIAYGYKFNSMFDILERFDSANPTIENITKLYHNLSLVPTDTLQTTVDEDFLSIKVTNGVFYVKKSAIDELENYKTKLLNLSKEYFTQLYQQDITIDYNESVICNINKLDGILKNLHYLINKSSLSIAYGNYAYDYFCTDGVENQEYWGLELGKRIKKFTKITHIRLTGIDDDTVYCEFTKKGKKVYQTSIKIKDNKILVSSIDFAEAKLISGE